MSKAPSDEPPDVDYEVGWGRPPSSTRWKKGQSGNPKGRPKDSKSAAAVLREILSRTIEVRDRGRVRNIIVLEGIWLRIVEKALKGDTKSAALVFSKKEDLEKNEPPIEMTLDMSAEEAQRAYKQMKDHIQTQIKNLPRKKR